MKQLVAGPSPVQVPVLDQDGVFTVHQVYCVGRNYADHAIEMGHDPNREPPFFFIKPAYAVMGDGAQIPYPALTSDLHHEVELVVALGSGGQHLSAEQAVACIYGYGVGIDLTRRDLQAEAKAASRPWEAGKVFLGAAPCSPLRPATQCPVMSSGLVTLEVNGEERQRGNLDQMIWKIPEIIARLSTLFPLYPGDLIFTGTPAGVGPVLPGDQLTASIEGVGSLKIGIASA